MAFNGVRSFRYALLAESAANIGSFIPMLFFPETVASLIFKDSNQITAASKSLIQWSAVFPDPPLLPVPTRLTLIF